MALVRSLGFFVSLIRKQETGDKTKGSQKAGDRKEAGDKQETDKREAKGNRQETGDRTKGKQETSKKENKRETKDGRTTRQKNRYTGIEGANQNCLLSILTALKSTKATFNIIHIIGHNDKKNHIKDTS